MSAAKTEINAPFAIVPCTDKDWSKECPHQIDASGWDGGSMSVEIPITDDELDAAITLLQEYRARHPRGASGEASRKADSHPERYYPEKGGS